MEARSPFLVAALMATSLWGCAADKGDGADDDVVEDDDDAADDDTAGTTPAWSYYTIGIRFEATGGTEGGAATIRFHVTFHEDETTGYCQQTLIVAAEYTHGADQSDELFEYIDQSIAPERIESTNGDCPASLEISATDLLDLSQWSLFPLAFVSCDSVAANPDLAAMELVEPSMWPEDPILSFEYVCEKIGDAARYFKGLGETEAIWLRPCDVGEFDAQSNEALVYLVPRDTSHTQAWALAGFSHVGEENTGEPVEGLEGTYDLSILWPPHFSVED